MAIVRRSRSFSSSRPEGNRPPVPPNRRVIAREKRRKNGFEGREAFRRWKPVFAIFRSIVYSLVRSIVHSFIRSFAQPPSRSSFRAISRGGRMLPTVLRIRLEPPHPLFFFVPRRREAIRVSTDRPRAPRDTHFCRGYFKRAAQRSTRRQSCLSKIPSRRGSCPAEIKRKSQPRIPANYESRFSRRFAVITPRIVNSCFKLAEI